MRKILAFAAVLAFTGAAGADLDFSVVAARVDAGVAAQSSKKVHAAYVDLQKRLARPDKPGLVDDFGKLHGVATKLAGPLKADTDLANATRSLLNGGSDSLFGESNSLLQIILALTADHDRARCQAARSKAGGYRDRAGVALGAGKLRDAARLSALAASTYESGTALATKLLAKQNARGQKWSVPLHDLGGALLSVWVESGPTPTVYVVGADDGQGPQFLRMGDEGWVRMPVAASGDLWWVNGVAGKVYASGSGGRVVRYDPTSGAMDDLSTGVTAILYGVWGSATTDVWAVGGNEDGTQPRSVILHHDGSRWTNVPLPAAANDRELFKVWGRAANDVWACGQAGLILHFDGSGWSVVPSGTFESLFTIHGSTPTISVGGSIVPALVEGNATSFVAASVPAGSETLRGVHVPPSGDAWACGLIGTVLRRTNGLWTKQSGLPTLPAPLSKPDFHAVFLDDVGGAYVVGGDLVLNQKGCLFYFGARTLPTDVLAQAKLSVAIAPLFSADHGVFRQWSCAVGGCHVAATPSASLNLLTDSHSMWSQFVGVQSTQSPLQRVAPGRPSQSYLWAKLAGTMTSVGGSGERMPNGGPFLDQADMDAVRAWILEGALDD